MVYFECVAELRHSGAFVALLRNSRCGLAQKIRLLSNFEFPLAHSLIKNGLYSSNKIRKTQDEHRLPKFEKSVIVNLVPIS